MTATQASKESSLDFSLFQRSRLPIVYQAEATECGHACMTMIANYFGHKIDLAGMRKLSPTSSLGVSVSTLINIGDMLSLSGRVVRVELKNVDALETPCILHWDMNHFVVLKEIRRSTFVIHDPALGQRHLNKDAFSDSFTGYAVEFSKAPAFKKVTKIERPRLSHLWSDMRGLSSFWAQLLGLTVFLQLLGVLGPFYNQLVIDEVLPSQDSGLLFVLLVGFLLVLLLQITIAAFREIVVTHLGNLLSFQITTNLKHHLLKLPLTYFERRHVADTISRFNSLDPINRFLTDEVVQVSMGGVFMLTMGIMLMSYSLLLGSLVLLFVLLDAIVRYILYQYIRNISTEKIRIDAEVDAIFMETTRLIQTIKLYGEESLRISIWRNKLVDAMNAGIRLNYLNIFQIHAEKIFWGVENIVVLFVAAKLIISGDLSIGMFFAVLSYKEQFKSSASRVIEGLIDYQMLSLHLERIGDISLEEREKGLEGDNLATIQNTDLVATDLSYRYHPGSPLVIENARMTIRQGEIVAIVGPSGGGKTTLIKLLLGLLPPESNGSVTFGGVEIHRLGLRQYRSYLATVMQSDELISGSVAENISFFDPEIDWKRLVDSARLAEIHEHVCSLPMHYQTLVGEMGSIFSGGQQQRILLARALYRRPSVLFLDEATSALDTEAEELINKSIKSLDITRIIVAHRRETIDCADRFYWVEDGKVFEVNRDKALRHHDEQAA